MRLLIFILIGLAAIGFIVGLISAVKYSLAGTPHDIPAFSRQIATAIGSVSATNLGAVLGIRINQAQITGLGAPEFFLAADAP